MSSVGNTIFEIAKTAPVSNSIVEIIENKTMNPPTVTTPNIASLTASFNVLPSFDSVIISNSTSCVLLMSLLFDLNKRPVKSEAR